MRSNFETLQKKCKRYHLKQAGKKIVLPLLGIGAIGAGAYLFLEQQPVRSNFTPPPIVVEKKEAIAITKIEPPKQPPVVVIPATLKPKVQKSLHKDVTYDLHVDDDYLPPRKIVQKSTVQKQIVVNDVVPEVIIRTPKEMVPEEVNKKVAMSTKKVNSATELIALFKNEKKYSLALKIAEEFYNSKEYSKASLWAKKANILDHEADGAWILYAKSEYAKGKKKRAIEILRLYLANANSNEGETLLLNWTQGK